MGNVSNIAAVFQYHHDFPDQFIRSTVWNTVATFSVQAVVLLTDVTVQHALPWPDPLCSERLELLASYSAGTICAKTICVCDRVMVLKSIRGLLYSTRRQVIVPMG